VNLLGYIINTIKKNKQTLTDASKKVGLKVNTEKTKYTLLSRRQNAGQNLDLKIGNRCNQNVKEAWSEVTSSNLSAAWQKIIPHCTNDFKGFVNEVTRVINGTAKFGFYLGPK
jgi:hypothetical protein